MQYLNPSSLLLPFIDFMRLIESLKCCIWMLSCANDSLFTCESACDKILLKMHSDIYLLPSIIRL